MWRSRASLMIYGMGLKQADAVIAEVSAAVKTWREEATGLHIGRSPQDEMAFAFGE